MNRFFKNKLAQLVHGARA